MTLFTQNMYSLFPSLFVMSTMVVMCAGSAADSIVLIITIPMASCTAESTLTRGILAMMMTARLSAVAVVVVGFATVAAAALLCGVLLPPAMNLVHTSDALLTTRNIIAGLDTSRINANIGNTLLITGPLHVDRNVVGSGKQDCLAITVLSIVQALHRIGGVVFTGRTVRVRLEVG